jgi:hypothetical protein
VLILALIILPAPAAALPIPLHFHTDTTDPWVLKAPGELSSGFPLLVTRQLLETMNGVPIGDGRINMGLVGSVVALFLEGDRSGNSVGIILQAILPYSGHTCQAHRVCDYEYEGLGKLRDIDGFVARAVGPWVPDAMVPMALDIHQTRVGELTRTTVDLWLWKPEDGPSPPVNPTPEPTTLLLWGTGAAGLGAVRWWKRRRPQAP